MAQPCLEAHQSLELPGIGSARHGGSFQQVLAEATPVPPTLVPKLCHANPIQLYFITGLSAQAINGGDLPPLCSLIQVKRRSAASHPVFRGRRERNKQQRMHKLNSHSAVCQVSTRQEHNTPYLCSQKCGKPKILYPNLVRLSNDMY